MHYHIFRMRRNIKSDAIILKVRRVGDYHKGVTCITPELGLVDAVVYGAYKGKSKLSGITDPLSSLSVNFYFNPVSEVYKITDAEEKYSFNRLKDELERFYRASLFSEIVLKSYGGGDESGVLFSLIDESFFVLNICAAEKIDFVVVQFLWRYMIASGLNPDLNFCGICGKRIEKAESLYLHETENTFVCKHCSAGTNPLSLNGGERRYLEYTSEMDIKPAMKIGLGKTSVLSLKSLLLVMIQNFMELSLNTLKSSFR